MKTDPIIENASTRDRERMIENRVIPSEAQTLFFKHSSDVGVIRNFGRRGSCYAPEAILSVVKKLAVHTNDLWSDVEVGNPTLEDAQFDEAQKTAAEKLELMMTSYPKAKKFISIGGGHDHVYPLLKAINSRHKNIVVINIDAHLDTRIDEFHNSGTPFRQFAREFEGTFKLIQLGIHDFANAKTTMSELGEAREVVATYEDLKVLTHNFSQNWKQFERMIPYDPEAIYLLSLDADALDSGIMEGVSAVNHRGLPYHFVEELLVYALDVLRIKHFGIYEYNPLYDNLSQKGARALASLIYRMMDH